VAEQQLVEAQRAAKEPKSHKMMLKQLKQLFESRA
jgi:hypothetical protein